MIPLLQSIRLDGVHSEHHRTVAPCQHLIVGATAPLLLVNLVENLRLGVIILNQLALGVDAVGSCHNASIILHL